MYHNTQGAKIRGSSVIVGNGPDRKVVVTVECPKCGREREEHVGNYGAAFAMSASAKIEQKHFDCTSTKGAK